MIRRERMTEDDVHEAAREHGIADLSQVQVAILENHGKISFLTATAQQESDASDHEADLSGS